MKTGKSLSDLAATLERNAESKVDYVANTQDMLMESENNHLRLVDRENHSFIADAEPTDHCHRQVATYTGIGTRYYEQMRNDSPALLAGNVHVRHAD
jgi:hypothetical protein